METRFGDWFDLPHWAVHNFTWWVLTDTHGRAAELRHLLSLAPPDARIIHLGDIGDRGPSSLECFQILDQTDAILIAGNHDLFIRPALTDPSHKTAQIMRNLWVINGGVAFMEEIDRVHRSGVKSKPPEFPWAIVMSKQIVQSGFAKTSLRSFS